MKTNDWQQEYSSRARQGIQRSSIEDASDEEEAANLDELQTLVDLIHESVHYSTLRE